MGVDSSGGLVLRLLYPTGRPLGWVIYTRYNLGDLPLCSEQQRQQAMGEQQLQAKLASERQALVALHNATGGADWWDSTNWLSDQPVGTWTGVDTDQDGYVVRLELYEKILTGQLPPELADLSSLKDLRIFGNRLTGCLPSGLQESLTNAQLGNLSYCP